METIACETKFQKLKRIVIENSESKSWTEAKAEWTVTNNFLGQNETCVCGQPHLAELFTIKNYKTSKTLHPIGSQCMKQFKEKSLDAQILNFHRANREMTEGPHEGRSFEWIYANHPTYVTRNHKDYVDKDRRALARFFATKSQPETPPTTPERAPPTVTPPSTPQTHKVPYVPPPVVPRGPTLQEKTRRLTRGKHAGKTFEEMCQNTNYIDYLRGNSLHREFEELVEYVDKYHGEDTPPLNTKQAPTSDESTRLLTRGKHAGKSFAEMCQNKNYIEYIRANGQHQELADLVAYFDRSNETGDSEELGKSDCML